MKHISGDKNAQRYLSVRLLWRGMPVCAVRCHNTLGGGGGLCLCFLYVTGAWDVFYLTLILSIHFAVDTSC